MGELQEHTALATVLSGVCPRPVDEAGGNDDQVRRCRGLEMVDHRRRRETVGCVSTYPLP